MKAFRSKDLAIRHALIHKGLVKPAPKSLFSNKAVQARQAECRRVTTGQGAS